MILGLEIAGTLLACALLIYGACKLDQRERRLFFEQHGRYPGVDDYVDGDAFR